jgi:uncharacterized protein (TIGR00730 family)
LDEFHTICVFCGSSAGEDPVYTEAARDFGRLLAERGLDVVTGGGGRGMMGAVADAALEAGARVTGVIPRALFDREGLHPDLTETVEVASMHERKQRMYALADGFVTLPGGLGTLEELSEIATWAQLGLHRKSIGLLNVAGYFDALIAFLDLAVKEGFLAEADRGAIIDHADADRLLERLRTYEVPPTHRWLEDTDEV